MARIKETINTPFGKTPIGLIQCDACGKQEAQLSDASYDVNPGWVKTVQYERVPDRYTKRVEREFCSYECVVRFVAPGLLDSDPLVVQQAINGLKSLEKELDGT